MRCVVFSYIIYIYFVLMDFLYNLLLRLLLAMRSFVAIFRSLILFTTFIHYLYFCFYLLVWSFVLLYVVVFELLVVRIILLYTFFFFAFFCGLICVILYMAYVEVVNGKFSHLVINYLLCSFTLWYLNQSRELFNLWFYKLLFLFYIRSALFCNLIYGWLF